MNQTKPKESMVICIHWPSSFLKVKNSFQLLDFEDCRNERQYFRIYRWNCRYYVSEMIDESLNHHISFKVYFWLGYLQRRLQLRVQPSQALASYPTVGQPWLKKSLGRHWKVAALKLLRHYSKIIHQVILLDERTSSLHGEGKFQPFESQRGDG